MKRLDYKDLSFEKVRVRGTECLFTDLRVERTSVPNGFYQLEVADDDSDGIPARIRPGILVNFYGTLLTKEQLIPDEGDTIYLEEGDWEWGSDSSTVNHTFLVQRKLQDGTVTSTIMTEWELLSYINFSDCHGENYHLFDITQYGKIVPCHYAGWKPQCHIQVIGDDTGEILLDGYGEDH